MSQEIDRVQQRARRYWYEDGLWEIGAGCWFLIGAGLFLAQTAEALPPILLLAAFVAAGIAGCLLTSLGVRWAKATLTFRRTGYAEPRREFPVVVLVLGSFLLLVGGPQSALGSSFLRMHWIVTLGLLYLGWKFKLARFFALALLSLLVGTGVALSGMEYVLGTAVYWTAMALAYILSGAIVLVRYLRIAPPQEEE